MRTIKEISNDIEAANDLLTKEVDALPYGVRPALRAQMIQASEKLPQLLDEMKSVVVPSKLVGLFASGDKTSIDKVAEFLTANDGVVIDAAQVYRTITDLVEPSYSRDRIFCTTQYSLLVQGITKIAGDLGYLEIESPKFKETICPDTASTLAHIKNCLRECRVGDQANVDILTKTVIDAIVKNEIDSKQIPVMVIGVTSTEERNAIAVLFSRAVDYVFPTKFEPSAQKIVALFKVQKQVDVDEKEEE
jgi:hypothetical protein